MVGARSAAMAFNRLVDRRLDAANPRTARRALPAGLVSPAFVAGFVVAAAALLVRAAWQLNPLALALSPLALGDLCCSTRTPSASPGRRTWCSALSLAGAPLGAWIAVRGDVAATPLVLAGAVLLWVAGFDVLYGAAGPRLRPPDGALLDPGALRRARRRSGCSALFHAGYAGLLLALLPRVYPPGLGAAAYWVGVAGCAGAPRLAALGGAAGRPLAAQRGLLPGQRRALGLALRGHRRRRDGSPRLIAPATTLTDQRSSSMATSAVV